MHTFKLYYKENVGQRPLRKKKVDNSDLNVIQSRHGSEFLKFYIENKDNDKYRINLVSGKVVKRRVKKNKE